MAFFKKTIEKLAAGLNRTRKAFIGSLKSLLTGTTMTRTYRSNDKIDKPELLSRQLLYSYAEGETFVFMDENYEQHEIPAEVLGVSRHFLVEDLSVDVLFHNGRPIEVTLPNFVEKTVQRTEPGARGNTATNVQKPAVVDGGYELQVPLFVNEGDVISIDTRTGTYADRVLKK